MRFLRHWISAIVIPRKLGPCVACHFRIMVGEVVVEDGRPPFLAGELLSWTNFHGPTISRRVAALPW